MENNSSNNCMSCSGATPSPNCHYYKDQIFTNNVIEIDNPENLILFHKVVIPASLGDETTNPPYPGKYANVLMVYEANGHAYLYSSDGIPTALGFDTGGILVVDEFPEIEQAAPNFLYIKKDTGDAKITTDNENWTIVNEPGGKVLIVDSLPDPSEARTNALYITANGQAQIVENSQWVLVGSGGGGGGTGDFNQLINRPKYAGRQMDSSTEIPDVEALFNSLSLSFDNKIDKVVMTDLNVATNPSTTTVHLDAAKENILTGARTTKSLALPVAGPHQAGVINTVTYNTILQNTEDIEAILGGAVAINNLPDPVTQQEITDAWKNVTGQTELINHATVYDVTNNKVWTYYANEDTWYPASNTTQINIDRFTNTSEGTIKGSLVEGQVFAETDGTGSVNGWDTLSAQVSDNTDNISDIQTAVDGKQDKLTAGNAITIEEDGTTSAWIYPERFFLDPDAKEGEGSVFEMSGTAHLKISDIKFYGETSQNQYKGVNLLNMPYDMTREGGLNLEYGQRAKGLVSFGDGTVALNGISQKLYLYKRDSSDYQMPVVAAGRYKTVAFINGDISPRKPVARIVIKSGTNEYYADHTQDWIVNIPSAITVDSIYLEFVASQTGSPDNGYQVCLIRESEFTDFEPFTNLLPSPSPDYPQRVMTATGEQELRGTGSNLYNYQDAIVVAPGVSADAEGYITFTTDGTQQYKNYYTNNLGLKPDTEYAIAIEVLEANLTNGSQINVVSGQIGSQFIDTVSIETRDLTPGNIMVRKARTKTDFADSNRGLRTFANFVLGSAQSMTLRISVLSDTSITPAKFKYQKYMGQTTLINMGKNIFDKSKATYNLRQYFNGNIISLSGNVRNMILYMPCEPYTGYSLPDQSSVGLSVRKVSTTERVPQVNEKIASQFVGNGTTALTYTTPARSNYLAIYYQVPTGVNIADKIQDIIDTLQIERANSTTPFSQYFEPLELCKLGSARDSIYREGLTWILHKEIEKITYDGTETGWTFNATNNSASIPHSGDIVAGDQLCSHFQVGDATSTNNTFSLDATSITFKSNEVITSLQAWKDWLAVNPLSIYAKLATPVETNITQPEILQGLVGARNTITYPDETSFSVGAPEDLPMYLWIEAYLNSLDGITKAIRDIPICC